MEFSSPATQRSSSSSEALVIQPGSIRSPVADAANDFARHLAENSKQRSDRRDDRPVERRERSATPERTGARKEEPAARETAREERDRDRKTAPGESGPVVAENATAPDAEPTSSTEAAEEDAPAATGEFEKAEGSAQAPAEDEADMAKSDSAADAAVAAPAAAETAPAKVPGKNASPIANSTIRGTGDAAQQQTAMPAGGGRTEGTVSPAAQAGEETQLATENGKTQPKAAAQTQNGAQVSAAQTSATNGTGAEQFAAAGEEIEETKSLKTEKGLGQEAAEKLAERKSGDRQTTSQTTSQANAAAAPAAGHEAARTVTSAPQTVQPAGTSANAGAASSGELPVSTVQQLANGNGNAATIRIGTLPGQSQPTQLPANTIALQMARNLQKGTNRFDIRLDPPEMGRIDVRMEVRKDGHVVAHMTVDRPETLDLLQRDARTLQQALNNSGLQADSDSLNFSLRDQSGDGSTDGSASGGRSAAPGGDADTETPLTPIYNVNLAANGGVDIRV